MKMRQMNWALGALVACVAVAKLGAADAPPREYLETKGWSIGFDPADRAVAEGLVPEIEGFDQRMTEAMATKHELGPDEVSKRAGELAKKTAAICALPAKAEDFQKEFERAAGASSGLNAALRDAFFLHKIEIWRIAEVRQRLAAGEKITGFVWDPVEKRPNVKLSFNWQIDPVDYRVTKTVEVLPAVFLRLEENGDLKAHVAAMKKELDDWVKIARQLTAAMEPRAVSTSMQVALRKVMKPECADEPASVWVCEGLVNWTWRELVLQSVPTKSAGKYVAVVARLPVPKTGDKPINLEVWPEKDIGDYPMMARQVFLNIAEADGSAALHRLLEAFWKLPMEQRTSANLRGLYQEQTKTALERRAPSRSLPAK